MYLQDTRLDKSWTKCIIVLVLAARRQPTGLPEGQRMRNLRCSDVCMQYFVLDLIFLVSQIFHKRSPTISLPPFLSYNSDTVGQSQVRVLPGVPVASYRALNLTYETIHYRHLQICKFSQFLTSTTLSAIYSILCYLDL